MVELSINFKKAKVIDVTKQRNDITITMRNQNVDKFVYLASTITTIATLHLN